MLRRTAPKLTPSTRLCSKKCSVGASICWQVLPPPPLAVQNRLVPSFGLLFDPLAVAEPEDVCETCRLGQACISVCSPVGKLQQEKLTELQGENQSYSGFLPGGHSRM